MLSNFVASEDKGNAEVRPPTADTECGQPLGGCESGLPFLITSKLITMARSINRMARVAIDLYEPKEVAKGRISIRRYGVSDKFVEVTGRKAMDMLVSFVAFEVIGKRIEKLEWEKEAKLYTLMKDLSEGVDEYCWRCRESLTFEICYNSRKIVRLFLDSVSRK